VFVVALVGWLGTMAVEIVAAIQRCKYKPLGEFLEQEEDAVQLMPPVVLSEQKRTNLAATCHGCHRTWQLAASCVPMVLSLLLSWLCHPSCRKWSNRCTDSSLVLYVVTELTLDMKAS
jgi:hypothetical protein